MAKAIRHAGHDFLGGNDVEGCRWTNRERHFHTMDGPSEPPGATTLQKHRASVQYLPMVTVVRPDALLLDLDGVLIDSTASVERHWRRFAAWFDVDPSAILASSHGVRHRDTIERWLPGRPRAEIEAAVRRFEQLEVEDAVDEVEIPGASALVAALPPGRWAVVTSCWRELANARCGHAGIGLPPVSITADMIARGKPDPEGYLAAAAALGVEPSRCIVVEDAPSGIVAAHRAGASVIALRTTTSDALIFDTIGELDYVVDDLRSVRCAEDGGSLIVTLTDVHGRHSSRPLGR